jgi:NADH-quinone oxidoreductase subunit G
MKEVALRHIPAWHDAAAREFIQDKNGPLFIASVNATKLDDIATQTLRAAPEEIARLGFAVAHLLDKTIPAPENLPANVQALAEAITKALSEAQRPVIISGASCAAGYVMKAAANVAWALHKKNNATGIVLTLPECNSLGLAMMGGERLQSAFNAVLNNHADTAIIMENDLYRHGKSSVVDAFLKKCKQVIVLDHLNHATAQKANFVIPAGTFADSDGIVVSNEGRAQRFFQVFESAEVIQESWRWLLNIGVSAGNSRMSPWKNFSDITMAISREESLLKGVEQITPLPNFRVVGQRVPREPHRYSGRTSMKANIQVSEEKPPEDPDSPLSYTMEGFRGLPPSSMIPFYWSPGWNSVQSINKYQEEIGGSLRGGDPGLRLFEPAQNAKADYFMSVPEPFVPSEGRLLMVPVHHIFGSEELSTHAASVSSRAAKPYIGINPEDALELGLQEGQLRSFDIDGQALRLPVKISPSLPRGMAGLPYGLPGLPFVELPVWSNLKKE